MLARRFWLTGLLLMLTGAVHVTPSRAQDAAKKKAYPTLGRIDAESGALEQRFPGITTATIEVIGAGLTWCEGPAWVPDDRGGYLLFSDIPRNTIFRWTDSGGIETYMTPSGYTGITYYGLEPGTNGLTLDRSGRLTMCEHGDRRVSVLTRGGGKLTLADRYEGKRLNSPNDLVFAKDGDLFFTDPPYGLPERAEDPRRELDFCGVYRLSRSGELTLLTKQLERPNGIGLSPDQKTLFIAQSDPENPIWMSFPIRQDKTLGEGKVLFNAKSYMQEFPGLPDGLAIHSSGVIFGSGPGAVYLLTPAGELLGRIITGGRTSNCTFNDDESVLYITNDDKILRVKLNG